MPRVYTTRTWILRARCVHSDTYNYDKVEYTGKNPVTITCKKHGDFTQLPTVHLRGNGCPKCGNNRKGQYKKLTIFDFIERSTLLHDGKYDYSQTDYVDYDTHVLIRCDKHGIFSQKPRSHLQGRGCMKCKTHKQCNVDRNEVNATADHFINAL